MAQFSFVLKIMILNITNMQLDYTKKTEKNTIK